MRADLNQLSQSATEAMESGLVDVRQSDPGLWAVIESELLAGTARIGLLVPMSDAERPVLMIGLADGTRSFRMGERVEPATPWN